MSPAATFIAIGGTQDNMTTSRKETSEEHEIKNLHNKGITESPGRTPTAARLPHNWWCV